MRVLAVGSDRSVFEKGSASAERQMAYGERLGNLDIIVFSLREHSCKETILSEHVRLYPTNSSSRIRYLFDAYRIARKLEKPDVVTTQDPFEAGLVGLLVARAFGARLHVQIHTDFLSPDFVRGSLLNRIRRLIARTVLSRAHGIRVVSDRIKESLTPNTWHLAPISILPIFVDTAQYVNLPRLKHPRFKISLLMMSRLEPEKGVEIAIRALKQARDEGHDAGLIILGDGSLQNVLQSEVRSLGLERFVEFKGFQEDVRPFLSEADIVLAPSAYEGYGLSIVTALSAAVPVLATDVGIAREAGAIIATKEGFSDDLCEWIERGPRSATLALALPESFDAYVEAWCTDIERVVSQKQEEAA